MSSFFVKGVDCVQCLYTLCCVQFLHLFFVYKHCMYSVCIQTNNIIYNNNNLINNNKENCVHTLYTYRGVCYGLPI